MKWFRLFLIFPLLFELFSCSKPPKRDTLAICAIFKDEAPWLSEWITYHHAVLGVNIFYLYNNDSTDNYREVLAPFLEKGMVTLIDWSSKDPNHLIFKAPEENLLVTAQLGAYNDCLKNKALGKVDWLAIIDIDEFIVPAQGVDAFYALLQEAKKRNKGTICLRWKIFGTSEVPTLKEGELLTEKLTWRAEDPHPWHQLVKSIHQPKRVDSVLVHIAEKVKPNFGGKTFSYDKVSIHHYWTRTEKHCLEKRKTSKEIDPHFFSNLHRIEDKKIFPYLPLLKKELIKLKSKERSSQKDL